MERKEYEKMFNSFSNISNANINPRYFEDFAIVQRAIYTLRDEINSAEKIISDHKAVVEKMQDKIEELEKENKSLKGANETMNIVINNMEDLGV